MAIEVLLNYPRSVLRRNGWEIFKKSGSFTGATRLTTGAPLIPGPVSFDPATGLAGDDGIWFEPNTGVLMLKPGPLWSTFVDDAYWEEDWFGLDSGRHNCLEVAAGEIEEQINAALGSSPIVFQTTREDDATPLTGIGALDTHLIGLDIASLFGMCWAGRSSRLLEANEGISLFVMPTGSMADSPDAYAGFTFGTEWLMTFHGPGFAWIWRRQVHDGTYYWAQTKRLDYQAGGFEGGQPFQVTMIPWGPDYISFVFSQTRTGDSDTEANANTAAKRQGFLLEMKRLGIEPAYNATIEQTIKTSPARVYIALPLLSQQVAFSMAAVRYVASGVRLAPEMLPEPMAHDTPDPKFYGIYGQKDSSGVPARFYKEPTMTTTGIGFENDLGATWTPATDTRLAMFTYLKPSGNQVHTPEMAGITAKVDPLIEEMDDSMEEDISSKWRRLSFDLSRDPKANICDLLLSREVQENGELHAHYQRLFQTGGTLKVTAKGEGEEEADVILFEGIVKDRRPVIRGSIKIREDEFFEQEAEHSLILDADLQAFSLWDELDKTSATGMRNLSRKMIADLLREGFKRAGFAEEQYSIHADLEDIPVDGADEGGDDSKLLNDSATIGELFRLLIGNFGRQGQHTLLIMPVDGVMVCRLETYYEVGSQIDWAFVLDSAVETPAADDETRWALGELRVLDDQIEIQTRLDQYNSVTIFAATRTGAGAEAMAVFIAPDPAIFDPASINHQVRVSHTTISPDQTALASTTNGLARFGRRWFDENCVYRPTCSPIAEWQPGVWPDQIIAILGRLPADFTENDLALGDPVSYGAWRILDIQPDISLDSPIDPDEPEEGAFGITGDRRFTRTAIYSLQWAGPTDIDGFPMWTTEEFWPQ